MRIETRHLNPTSILELPTTMSYSSKLIRTQIEQGRMRVRIKHTTRYLYDELVTLGPHVVRLFPANHLTSELLTYNLSTNPSADQRWQTDAWGNRLCRLTFDGVEPAADLTITVDASFDLRPVNPFDFFVDDGVAQLPIEYSEETQQEFAPFLTQQALDDSVREWMEKTPPSGGVIDFLVALNQQVASDIGHIIRLEPGLQTPAETLAMGKGSCRDSAWLLCSVLRARGFIARFVSGYLIQLKDEGNIPGLARGMDKDVLDLHAWAEVFLPGAGWIGFDATSGLLCSEGHIPLSSATQPSFAAPLAGSFGTKDSSGVGSSLSYTMEVERIGHQPRPRKPYTDQQYVALLAAGDHVDARLDAAGVTLTTTSAPTWTSRERPGAPEWTSEILGSTKLAQGRRFVDHIRERAPGYAVVLHANNEHIDPHNVAVDDDANTESRLARIDVIPAPGVLKVRFPVQPRTRGYAEIMQMLAEAAASAGLSSERFQLDGRSVGPGGGNHITLGGGETGESIFLQRPDVLASLVAFTINHPALSYFFAGVFVRQSIQAPSLDDVGGRGFVELPAFEMPPNERMATAQVFLMRALITAFIETPYDEPLTQWGARLHDRFMLPTLLWNDLLDILDYLDRAGIPCDSAWFDAFLECRFPVMGRMSADGVEIQIRPALEPWSMLKQDRTADSTVGYWDTSMERIELVVRGFGEERHQLVVNGVQIPLHGTRDEGVRVAGVKFRAWIPQASVPSPRALGEPDALSEHNLRLDHPLKIDLLDMSQQRSIAGAAYHVWHPNGQAFEQPPLTEFEAAARRNSRFTRNRHMPYPAIARHVPREATERVTLDLSAF